MEEGLPSYSPQSIHDILPLYHPEDSDGRVQAYALRQLSTNTQIVSPKGIDVVEQSYQIKTFATGGFMNKKPHIIISKYGIPTTIEPTSSNTAPENHNDNSRLGRRFSILPSRDSDTRPTTQTSCSNKNAQTHSLAEARFDIHGTGTSILYTSSSSAHEEQRLDLENSQAQILRTTICGIRHYWQPFAGNKYVLELINDMEDIVARFTYTAPAALSTGAATGRKKSIPAQMEVGELHIVEALVGSEQAKEEVICSAVVVIERARRRAANIGYQGVGYKQGAACGPTMGAYGGGVQMHLGG